MIRRQPRSTLLPDTKHFRSVATRKHRQRLFLGAADEDILAPVATYRCLTTRQLMRVVGETSSEEHTSELQSRQHFVCRLLLEKNRFHYYRPYTCSSTRGYLQ